MTEAKVTPLELLRADHDAKMHSLLNKVVSVQPENKFAKSVAKRFDKLKELNESVQSER